ncbi:MAG: hypothetical protein WBR10_08015 [Candidatus Acidiferrum sp.]
MPCESYREALREAAAADFAPSPELRSHFDACASCRATFAEEAQLFAALDEGVRVAANAEVPASLLPRVRAEWNHRHVPRRSWVPATTAIAAAALVLVIVFVRGYGRDAAGSIPQVSSVAGNVEPDEIKRTSPATVAHEEASPAARNKAVRAVKISPTARVEEAAVLISAGQKQAIDALLLSFQQGEVDASALLAEKPERALQELKVAPIDLSPIEMKPLEDVTEEPAPRDNHAGQ